METIKTIVIADKKYSLSNDIPTWCSIEELINISLENNKKLEIKKNNIKSKKSFRKKYKG